MKPRLTWLIATALMFAGWIGWLAYLAATTTPPIVLSRPQFLVSKADLIADLKDQNGRPSSRIQVRDVHWPARGHETLLGKTITITNLQECQGYAGPGTYILALVPQGSDEWRVAGIPPSPGYEREAAPRIYPLTHETSHQLDAVPKPAQ
jgi:hypothetical protein